MIITSTNEANDNWLLYNARSTTSIDQLWALNNNQIIDDNCYRNPPHTYNSISFMNTMLSLPYQKELKVTQTVDTKQLTFGVVTFVSACSPTSFILQLIGQQHFYQPIRKPVTVDFQQTTKKMTTATSAQTLMDKFIVNKVIPKFFSTLYCYSLA